MLHKCFLDSETSVYFPSTRRWVWRNIDWIFQLCVKNKLDNNLNGVRKKARGETNVIRRSVYTNTHALRLLVFFLFLCYNVNVMTCKFEWSRSLSLQWRENISVWCAAKCTSAAAPAICQTEGCTLKTHSLPRGTHIYQQFTASPPTPAHLCCDIHPRQRHTTDMQRPCVASHSQKVCLIRCHWIRGLCEDAVHKVGRANAKKKRTRFFLLLNV